MSEAARNGTGEAIAELAERLRARQGLGRSEGLNRLFDYLAARAAEDPNMSRGEIVLVVAGAPASEEADAATAARRDRLLSALLAAMPLSAAVDLVADVLGERRNRVYERALELRRDAEGEDRA